MMRSLISLIFLIVFTSSQRQRLIIQDLISTLKNGPKHYSISPSFNGERRYDVIGTGELPLQSDLGEGDPPDINDVITGNIAQFETGGRKVVEDIKGSEQFLQSIKRKPSRTRGKPLGGRRLTPDNDLMMRYKEQFNNNKFTPVIDNNQRGSSVSQIEKRKKNPFKKPLLPVSVYPRLKRKFLGPQRGPPPKMYRGPPMRQNRRNQRPQKFNPPPPNNFLNKFEPLFQGTGPLRDGNFRNDPGRRNYPNRGQKRNRKPISIGIPTNNPIDNDPYFSPSDKLSPPFSGQDFSFSTEKFVMNSVGDENKFVPDKSEYVKPHVFISDDGFSENAEKSSNSVTDRTDSELEPGFFNDAVEDFPDFSDFGMTWESQKIRKKRSTPYNPFHAERPLLVQGKRRPRRGPRPRRRPSSKATRRFGPSGFWDDDDFDADFFSNNAPNINNNFDSYYQSNQEQPVKKYKRPRITAKKFDSNSFNSQYPYTYFKPDNKNSNSEVTFYNGNGIEDNTILGSGNFEILKGGTFFDTDDYRQPYSKRPQSYSYPGTNDIFHNFRDFADIKGERKRYQEYYYK